MSLDPDFSLDAPLGVVRRLLREAALRILAFEGYDLPPDPIEEQRRAYFAGFKIGYYKSRPGVICRRGRGVWCTPTSGCSDDMQHVIDVDVGEQVISLGWRDGGPIHHEFLKRGPWERELLSAAGMHDCFDQSFRMPPAAALDPGGRVWSISEISARNRSRLSKPVTFSVLGYSACAPEIAPAGSSFHELMDMVSECYLRSRSADVAFDTEPAFSSFALSGWSGKRPFRSAAPTGKPDFRYWISARGGVRTAAALLLLLDASSRRFDLSVVRSIAAE